MELIKHLPRVKLWLGFGHVNVPLPVAVGAAVLLLGLFTGWKIALGFLVILLGCIVSIIWFSKRHSNDKPNDGLTLREFAQAHHLELEDQDDYNRLKNVSEQENELLQTQELVSQQGLKDQESFIKI